jgi:isopenicillin N synthase-like dioxygenase
VEKHCAVPIVDFSGYESGRVKPLIAQIAKVCEETGFMMIKNHGLPASIVDQCWQKSLEFFDSSLENRLTASSAQTAHPYCYHGLEAEALALSLDELTPPDLKETFNMGPFETPCPDLDEGMGPEVKAFVTARNTWPVDPAGFQPALENYYREVQTLANRVMALFAMALDLPSDYFEASFDRPMSAMRVINYPALAKAPLEGQLRAGAHTDYGTLTLLLQQEARTGLQVLCRGEWHDVPAVPGTIVVNIGDLMSRWTNDRWVSTLHRVVIPPTATALPSRRQSLVYFHTPNWDAEIGCIPTCVKQGEKPRYEPVFAGPHLAAKFIKTVQY